MRSTAVISVAGLGALLLVVGVLLSRDNPKRRVAAVKECFGQMSNVRLTYVSDLEKQASQVISAYVEVEGKGEVGFIRLSPVSFGRSPHTYLEGIGPYGFRTRQLISGQQAYGYDIDIGPSSPIPDARKLGITNVQSAVAHYDDLVDLISGWPVTTNEWPTGWPVEASAWSSTFGQEIRFVDSAGQDCFFCLKRSDSEVSR